MPLIPNKTLNVQHDDSQHETQYWQLHPAQIFLLYILI